MKAEVEEKLGTIAKAEDDITKGMEEKPDFEEARRLLVDFYQGEEEKWAEAGYSKEDIAEQFSEQHLASLNLEDYALLLKRFPGEMVTHVTRQGVRDHGSSIWHTAGIGSNHDGFKDMLESGKLRSALSIAMQEHDKEVAIAEFLHLDRAGSREDALSLVESKFDWNLASNNAYADVNSVHVASEHVADAMYGAEKGNEVFVAYPSAYVASQLHYGGKGMLTDANASAHNDKWIYTKDGEGMPLDAGLIFIPEDADVDVGTGSQYELGEGDEPIEHRALIEAITGFASSPNVSEFVDEAKSILGKFTGHWADMSRLGSEKAAQVEALKQKLAEGWGITDPKVQEAVLNYQFLNDLIYHDPSQGVEKVIKDSLASRGALYERAKSTVNSKSYWEDYFVKNLGKKPSKVVYYSGGDPSRALNEWREKNCIVKKSEDPTLGFPESNVSNDSEAANQGKDRFRSLARKVIDDKFPEKEDVAETNELELTL